MTSRTLFLWAPVVIYMAAIFFVSGDPEPPAPAAISDKWLHMLAYCGLAVLVFRAVAGGIPARLTSRSVVATLLVTIGYGLTDELHQMYVPRRSMELYDVYADAAGAAIGLFACWAWAIIQLPASNSQPPA